MTNPLDTKAHTILDAVIAYYAAQSIPLPAKRYVAAGDPSQVAWDCEQVTVALATSPMRFSQEGSGDACVVYAVPRWRVQIVRCVPDNHGKPVDAVDLEAIAATLFLDHWSVHRAVLVAATKQTPQSFGSIGPRGLYVAAYVDMDGPVTG